MGTLFFTISPEAAKDKVLLYLLLTIAPFAVVAPALSPLLDRGATPAGRHRGPSVGSAVLVFLMANDINGLLLFPEAFGVLVLSKLYLVAKAALVPSMTDTEDDLAMRRQARRAGLARRLCRFPCRGRPAPDRSALGAAGLLRGLPPRGRRRDEASQAGGGGAPQAGGHHP